MACDDDRSEPMKMIVRAIDVCDGEIIEITAHKLRHIKSVVGLNERCHARIIPTEVRAIKRSIGTLYTNF